jgi:hypothetical protein
MKYSASLVLLTAVAVEAFSPLPTTVSRAAIASETVLYISSWGTKGGAASPSEQQQDSKNIEKNIQAYLKAPQSVEARSNIDGVVLVSGLVKSKERTDQYIFDLLNHEESAFEFNKIVAFVDDVAFAKKRLLSRSARYGGLLNKLDFVQASEVGSLPSVEQLEGVKTWVAYFEDGDLVAKAKQVAELAKAALSVENVAILLANANEIVTSPAGDAVQALKDSGKKYTLVAVGKLEDHAEGKIPYKYALVDSEEGVLPGDAIFSRDEAMRMITECLQLECGVDKALSFFEVYDANATEAKLVKGLREAGYARPQEIDHMLRDGPKVGFLVRWRKNMYFSGRPIIFLTNHLFIQYRNTNMLLTNSERRTPTTRMAITPPKPGGKMRSSRPLLRNLRFVPRKKSKP